MQQSQNKIEKFFEHFLLIDDTPHKIAAGAALGIFLGIIPGEGVTASLVFSTLFRLNKLAATAGALATNMWTTVIVLPMAALVGGWLFHVSPTQLIHEFEQTFDAGWKHFLGKAVFWDLTLPLLTGFILIAAVTAALSYIILYFLLRFKRKQKTYLFHQEKA